jgi:hypothetical protein
MKFFASFLALFALFFNLGSACLQIAGYINSNNYADSFVYDNGIEVCHWTDFHYTWDNGDNAQWMNCINDHYAYVDLNNLQFHYAAHGDNFAVHLDSYWGGTFEDLYMFKANTFC